MSIPIKISGIAYEVNDLTHKYVVKRVNHLVRCLPRHARKSASAEVRLEQVNHDHGNKYEVEVKFNIPDKIIIAKDSTGNIMAAIDIVEEKIKAQLSDYKEATVPHIGKRGIVDHFKRNLDHKQSS
jgi:ribosomal subunit interface protein